jgi:hypothetical protein
VTGKCSASYQLEIFWTRQATHFFCYERQDTNSLPRYAACATEAESFVANRYQALPEIDEKWLLRVTPPYIIEEREESPWMTLLPGQ